MKHFSYFLYVFFMLFRVIGRQSIIDTLTDPYKLASLIIVDYYNTLFI